MDLNTRQNELDAQAKALLQEVKAVATKDEVSGEEWTKIEKQMDAVRELKQRAVTMGELEEAIQQFERPPQRKQAPSPGTFKSLGEFASTLWQAKFNGRSDRRLTAWYDRDEPATPANAEGWVESKMDKKDLLENIGASGGFLVPVEQRTELLQIPAPELVFRPRATRVPMARRQIQWPVLDQTNTTSGRPAWFGGVLSYWTEEGEYKTESDPAFRQINLVAHKLVSLTEASDELLADSAQSLEALLTQLFTGAIGWYEEHAFMNGTGAGQPRGVINAPATFAQARAVAGAVGIVDIINMLEHSYGNPVWLISKSVLPSLMQLNGPAANPSYVFMPNARDGMPGTLFGYPVIYNEHCPILGSRGDIGLYDLRYYLIGDRSATTIDASKHDKFRYDLTVWRAVHRVDGQPWLSQPIYLQDGTTQVSPFVVLDAATGS